MIESKRLFIRPLVLSDAAFIYELVNQPDFIRFIGDKGVRSLDDALSYLNNGPLLSYQQHGFGLMHVALKSDLTPVGMCGLLQRDFLDEPDVGYAFLADYCGKGFASEALDLVLNHAHKELGKRKIAAITDPGNAASIKVLLNKHFIFDRTVQSAPNATELNLYMRDLSKT